MNRKLACMVATVAWVGSAAGALADDAAAGEKLFNQKCKVCHHIGEGAKNFVGPELNGLIGRAAGSVEGYNYSDAMKNSGITWDEAIFEEFITNPKAKVPGTKMIFAGLSKEKDRANLFAFVSQFDASGAKK